MSEILANDIHSAIEETAEFRKPKPERRFHKHDEYLSYGLYTADFKKIMKGFQPYILQLSLEERLDTAAMLLAEHIGELGHAGIIILALSVDELAPTNYPQIDCLLEDFRSWSHVDHMCVDVAQPLLRNYPIETLDMLDEWNKSPNRFKRRASVVTFTRSVGAAGDYIDEALDLCDNLIWDPEDIVQKGVGWALKDNLRSNPDRVITYVKKLRRTGVPSTITLYAIRDLKGEDRKEVLAVKKDKFSMDVG